MNYSDEELLEYLDSQMSAAALRRFQDAARRDPSLHQRIDTLEASRLPYGDAYRQAPVPPVPSKLREEVAELARTSRSAVHVRTAVSPQRLAVVAGLALSLGVFLGHLVSSARQQPEALVTASPSAEVIPVAAEDDPWVSRVADYQTLYVAETLGNAEGGLERAERLLSTLQTEGGLQTAIPDLSAFGYTFARAQRLGFEGDMLVQLVYTRAGRMPLAFCYMRAPSAATADARFGQREALTTATWRQQGQRFVIVADEPASTLESMVKSARTEWL